MKTYRVILTDEALDQAFEFIRYIAEQAQSLTPAERWWTKAQDKLATLESFPHRCPYAPENDRSKYELRMLIVDRCH